MFDLPALRQEFSPSATDRQRARYLTAQAPEPVGFVFAHAIAALGLHMQAGHSAIKLGELSRYLQPDPRLPQQPEQWLRQLDAAPTWLVGREPHTQAVLIHADDRLYFQRIWHYEQQAAKALATRLSAPAYPVDPSAYSLLDTLFPPTAGDSLDWQRVAAASALAQRFCLISGGPGTGKTRTVTRILATLVSLGQIEPSNTALVAPTGKAAGRLSESLSQSLAQIEHDLPDLRGRLGFGASTLHSLLGTNAHNAHTKHHRDNPLPYRLIVVDEASMLDLSLLSRLLDACTLDTQLIFLGDRDQLPSVAVGDTLGQLFCYQDGYSAEQAQRLGSWLALKPPLTSNPQRAEQCLADHAVLLRHSHRFASDSGIGQLASAINQGQAQSAIELLHQDHHDLAYHSELDQRQLLATLSEHHQRLAEANTPEQALAQLPRFQLLVAKRKGPHGVEQLNAWFERRLSERGLKAPNATHYHARAIMITENAAELGIYNGDTGLIFDGGDGYFAYFQASGKTRKFALSLLPAHESAFAMTIHKSQGSEFDHVWYLGSEQDGQVGLRTLLYTAVTRAKQRLTLTSSETLLRTLIKRTSARDSGLLQSILKYRIMTTKESG